MGHKRQPGPGTGDVNLGGMFRSLGGFLDLLSNLAEKAGEVGEFHRSGELGDDQKGVKAVYGFSVRVGGGGQPRIEKFGNVKDSGQGPVVEEAREPMVDVFDEDEHLLVVAELPGVEAGDIHFEVKDDVLALGATHGDRKYGKEVLLPSAVKADAASSSYRNGVLEIKLPKAK
jgi:HSP20 family protein